MHELLAYANMQLAGTTSHHVCQPLVISSLEQCPRLCDSTAILCACTTVKLEHEDMLSLLHGMAQP